MQPALKKVVAAMHAMQMQLVFLLSCLTTLAQAQIQGSCGPPSSVTAYPVPEGSLNHSIDKPLPLRTDFNQPSDCGSDVWFFDLNRNGTPDPDEPRLYGPQRVVACSSCHTDSTDSTLPVAGTVPPLRQGVDVLCVVCHRR
jgi:hypothetical protein